MASLRWINRIIPSRSFSCAIRKSVSADFVAKKSRSFVSLVPRATSSQSFLPTSLSFSRVCGCGMHNISEGDEQLLAFLKEEIIYEKETLKNLDKPKLEFFNQPDNLKEIKFKMTRLINGERIVVSFDVDQSINHETDVDIDNDDDDQEAKNYSVDTNALGIAESIVYTHSGTRSNEIQITSYPSFSVQITKDSGETLHFNCEYNIDDGEDSTDDEEHELFSITDVSLLPHPDADHSNVYHCETENMDYNLYELLMGMLAERGVDSEFVSDLLKKSTILEHEHYMQFLEGLQDFLTQK